VKETISKSPGRVSKYEIFRKFHIRKHARHFIDEVLIDLQDTAFLDHQIKRFQPDVIYLGHIQPLSKAIMPYLAGCKIPIVYDEGGSGLIHSWEHKGIWFYFVDEYVSRYFILNKVKPVVVNMISRLSGHRIKSKWDWPDSLQVVFNSELNLKNAITRGVPVNNARVIHSGIDTERFNFVPKTKLGLPLSFIVPGRIEPLKGQLDAVRLLAALSDCGMDGNMIFIGENYSASFYLEMENEIKKYRLGNKITLMPMVAQDKLIDLYHLAGICLFPSYHKTGYSRVPLEAMACGCIVFSYGNEGSDEIIKDGQTGFLFSPDDYSGMIAVVKEMISNPGMVRDVIGNARRDVEENCSMEKYVDKMEETVRAAVGAIKLP
jgi:glycosyltransferase involved in cell wall biosynthesis